MSVPRRRARPPRARRAALAPAAVVALLLATACAGGGDDEDGALTFWTSHVTPDRIAQQEATAHRFTQETGIAVNVVPMAAADQNQALVTGAASGDVPDVVMLAPDQAAAWSRQGLLDTEVATATVERLGRATFNERALEMVTVDGTIAAVPSDGWGQVLLYREDLFAAAGLEPPETLHDVAAAAEALDTDGVAGIVLGTKPGDPFTTQTLEALLLANGCRLTDGAGEISLGSPACVEGLELYARLAAASVPGDQDVESTRAAYLAGESAMLFWGTHIFDELAGLAPDFPPTCDECARDPRFLADNSGVALLADGARGGGGQYGVTLNLGVPHGADTAKARRFIEFLLGDGYLETLGVSPEGRVPMRSGTPEEPSAFTDAWADLPTGESEETRTPLSRVYDEATISAILDGAGSFQRWGYGGPDAVLAGSLASQNALVQELGTLLSGGDAREYAEDMTRIAEEVRTDIE
ncbi:ABC transporter substrate-binding protein [Marinactinospora thermotolerans]|uniref:Multiple sugar transport system substrate-binding protein n=1 Tax=Marinactinospora thermotolerans DSM 45154 TaxID=1122192 RepID=A0A1T4LUT9_9ACTN|nr:extracellular solute-binding protein [Marinactinospora thermotolerans]SJZ58493.1 multiple sugar transport system substrate-binding protein [Marinactinospora thermotolerans DSM 45154]